ncbi:MAG: hypothetical protein RL398_1409 [Planctomycetota bacterium]|jgi:SAM-dependent methyltransferase
MVDSSARLARPEYDAPLTTCTVCGEGPLRPFDRDDYRGNRIDRCAACGVLLVNPQYTDRWLAQFYADYNSLDSLSLGDDVPHRKLVSVRTEGKRRALQWLAKHRAPGRILMVGCGDGLELQVGKELGWQPEGYDVDEATTKQIAAHHGVPVHCGELATLASRVTPFEAVFMDQVIEHPKNPGAYLRMARDLLVTGGVLFVATPNIRSLSACTKTLTGRLGLRGKRRGRHYDSGHHLTGFSPPVMRRVLPKLGFEVLAMRAAIKPQRNPVTGLLGDYFPFLDSNFAALARKL